MKILWDVDTQYDFVYGSLQVPEADKITGKFKEAIDHFESEGYAVMGSVDVHVGKEADFPLHCIKGTKGQMKIPETQGDILYVSDKKYEPDALEMVVEEVKAGRRIYLEKDGVDMMQNPNTEQLMKMLDVTEAYLIGLATNICVYAADKAFKSMGIKTYLVEGATKGLDTPDSTEAGALENMLNNGTEMYKIR